MITNVEELEIKKSIMKISRRTYLLCDHTKISTDALVKVCALEDLDGIITGKELDEKNQKMLSDCVKELILA